MCIRAALRHTAMQFQNPATFTYSLSKSYIAPPPSLPPRCTEAQSRMEQGCVRWQWHPSHAMNNQWTPSGAYNRGAQLQSCSLLCLSLSLTHSLSLLGNFSHLFPRFSHTYYHYAVLSRFVSSSLVFLHLLLSALSTPTTTPHAPHWPLWQVSHGIPHSNSAV